MNFIKATTEDFVIVRDIVINTINTIYPRYYPKGAVSLFVDHHSDVNILNDIEIGVVFLLEEGGLIVGTGTLKENEIARVFVLPDKQGIGYGTLILNELESMIDEKYTTAILDSSLPAYSMYIKRGYVPLQYHKIPASNGDFLCYHRMIKELKR